MCSSIDKLKLSNKVAVKRPDSVPFRTNQVRKKRQKDRDIHVLKVLGTNLLLANGALPTERRQGEFVLLDCGH